MANYEINAAVLDMIVKLPLIGYYTMIISRVLSITARQPRKVYYSSTENTAVKVDVLGCTIFMHYGVSTWLF